MAIIGIDLGTTNSLAAVWRNGNSELIPNAFGEFLTPSVVSVNEEGDIFVGKVAKERLISHPGSTASLFKRFMGTGKTYKLAGKSYKPQELSALVLKKLKEDAENYLEEPVTEAIVSVPAYFSNAQRDATKQAGQMAGLLVERIINEPSAAALACQHLYPEEECMEMVFDFGGGTLDVSVVDCFDNVINVVAISGDNHLGGCDFDQAIAEFFCREHGIRLKDLTESEQAIFVKSAENCKSALSEQEEVEMAVHYGGKTWTSAFDTKKMIEASASVFGRMLQPMEKAVSGAEIGWEDIDRIILVGGSCKMPAVRLYLQHFLKKEVIFLGSPDTIVALGAGTYAGIKERCSEIRDMLLTDVCPFTLGVAIRDGIMSPIIERNTALPVSKAEIYQTVYDGQDKLKLEIYQGESIRVEHNIQLDDLEMQVPPAPAGRETVLVRFTYDINGILEVDAEITSTGKRGHLVIVEDGNKMNGQQIERRLQELKSLKIHPRDREENMYLISRCEALYEQAGERLREFLSYEMQYFEFVMNKQDDIRIKKARKRFSRAMDSAEEHMDAFGVEKNLDAFSSAWYDEAKEEEMEMDEEFTDLFGKGHLTS
ncbi:Hsp70 family protein [Hespellia stercorisuis]|uniref:Chaperone protein DnaK n=1 Tax=Hespellia stercorisuis DSM 15480 TaxID=1121950 RepID=A0A1M6U688_9FIRM|nr:molecular chaperone HscC [Hespellia stercorisuis]SHK64707.1 molecular chaperone HscC [Hespellia stercorisuis DSM 15480]